MSPVVAGLAWQGQRASEETEVVVGPELYQRNEGAAGDEVVAFARPAGVEVAHQVAAGRAKPGEDLEGIAGHPAGFGEVALEAGVLGWPTMRSRFSLMTFPS